MSEHIPCPEPHPRGSPIVCGCAEFYIRGEVVRRRRPQFDGAPYVPINPKQRAMLVTLTVAQLAGIVERALAGVEAPWIDLPADEREP